MSRHSLRDKKKGEETEELSCASLVRRKNQSRSTDKKCGIPEPGGTNMGEQIAKSGDGCCVGAGEKVRTRRRDLGVRGDTMGEVDQLKL